MQTTWEIIEKALAAAQNNQLKQANKYQKNISFTVNDKVW